MLIYKKYVSYLEKNDVIVFNKNLLDVNLLCSYLKKNKLLYFFTTLAVPFIIMGVPFPFKSLFKKYIDNIIILFQREQI